MAENEHDEPTIRELMIITRLARADRLVAQGMSPIEAANKICANETAKEYTMRNKEAMAALEERMMSSDYQARFEAIRAITDPVAKASAEAAIKRENFSAIDMEAVRRTIRSRNRQMKAEGMLPPDAAI